MSVDAMTEASRSAEDAARAIPAPRQFAWSVRREIWENRSLYLAPIAVAGIFLVGFFISLVRLPERIRAAAPDPAQLQEVIEQPYVIVAIVLMAIYLLVAVFYCLDALYGERRDRSLLFWKSMPVSDLTTVLSKASIPILVLPLVTFAVTVATSFVMLLTSSIVLAGAGLSATTPWTRVPFFEMTVTNFLHVVVFHGIWWAPFYGWLLLASAWAKRAPLLWAALPPVAIGALERIAFGTSYFAGLVQYRLVGGMESGPPVDSMTMDMLALRPLGQFLIGPGMWVGLAITAAFLFVAARLHRSRGTV